MPLCINRSVLRFTLVALDVVMMEDYQECPGIRYSQAALWSREVQTL